MLKEIQIEDVKWEYYLEENVSKTPILYRINFVYPTKLTAKTNSMDIYNKLGEKKKEEIVKKLDSAIHKKYNSKIEDSLETKLKIFLFTKAFTENVSEYLKTTNYENLQKELDEFTLDSCIANLYSSQFYQFNQEKILEYQGHADSIKQIVKNLTTAKGKYLLGSEDFKKNFTFYTDLKNSYLKNHKWSEKNFRDLIKEDSCAYCGITIKQIGLLGEHKKLHNKRSETRGYSLEIDRKEPNLEYTKENCCMSCYWCNNAKTDEFLPYEFKGIARGINAAWNCRGKDIESFPIPFSEDSEVWKNPISNPCKENTDRKMS